MRGLTTVEYELMQIVVRRSPPDREPTIGEIIAAAQLEMHRRVSVTRSGDEIEDVVATAAGREAMRLHELLAAMEAR